MVAAELFEEPEPDIRNSSRNDDRHRRPATLSSFLPAIFLLTLALLPIATATQLDPYTSYDGASIASDSGLGRWSDIRQTPVITSFLTVIRWVCPFDIASAWSALGRLSVTLGKRELSNGEIAEACIIPALVALSGIFAGLTLG